MDKHNEEHIYVAIDLKSFYASVECRERGKDALTTNLVVADPTRTEKTILRYRRLLRHMAYRAGRAFLRWYSV